MNNEQEMIQMLQEEHKGLEDTCENLEGLIRKLTGIAQAMDEFEYERFSTPIKDAVTMMSEIHGELYKVAHMVELERNRAINECETPLEAAGAEAAE